VKLWTCIQFQKKEDLFIEGDEFFIPLDEHLKVKRKREEDPDFDWEKELRALAIKYSQGIPKWDN
jgi:hypothetical protein